MVRIYDIAHCRAGDKGDTSNISVIAYDAAGWEIVRTQVTADVVMRAFAHIARGPIRRYELPKLHALKFVAPNALPGGVQASLHAGLHWQKAAIWLLLDLEIE